MLINCSIFTNFPLFSVSRYDLRPGYSVETATTDCIQYIYDLKMVAGMYVVCIFALLI